MISDEQASRWEHAAVDALARCEALEGLVPTLAHAVLVLAKDRDALQRYADRVSGCKKQD